MKSNATQPREWLESDRFRQEVDPAGYRWGADRRLRGDRVLVGESYQPVFAEGGARSYDPLETPDLFRQFVAIEPTEEGILPFAALYGMLGTEPDLVGQHETKKGHTISYPLERLSVWQREIREMRRAAELWDLYAAGRDVPSDTVQRGRGGWYFAGEEIRVVHLMEGQPTPLDAVRHFVSYIVSAQVGWHCAPRLEYSAATQKSSLRLRPKNLLGAMWWQFAKQVLGEIQFRPCKTCGTLIKIARDDDGKRIDREFCSGRCQQADHRRKVKLALELNDQGMKVKEIAQRVGAREAAVKNWLSKKK